MIKLVVMKHPYLLPAPVSTIQQHIIQKQNNNKTASNHIQEINSYFLSTRVKRYC